MRLGTRTTRAQPAANDANASTPRDAHASNATHGKKLPISNRQKLARLESVVTHTEQSPKINTNRHFWDPRVASPAVLRLRFLPSRAISTPYNSKSRNRVKPFKMRNLKISNTYKWTLLRSESARPNVAATNSRAGRPRQLKQVPRRAVRSLGMTTKTQGKSTQPGVAVLLRGWP
jgi:hypothetical protein